MADKKISALTPSTTPLTGAEVLPIVQSGSTVKVSVADLTAGRAVAATSITTGLGAVGTPAYTFSGDTNTGIYSPAADTIAFVDGGVESMRITSAGAVGIGTTTPFVKFQIDQNQATYSYFDYYNTTAGGGIVWRQIVRNIANTGNATVDFTKLIGSGFALNNTDTNAANFTSFGVGASERMRIDSSGNVGIGTSSPGAKLDVAGIIRSTIGTGFKIVADYSDYRMVTVNGRGWRMGASSNGTNLGDFYIQGSTDDFTTSFISPFYINSSGNVGIGTSTPNASAILDVQSTTKGFRLPNMTTTQKNAISSPAAGLMVFDTTLAKACVYSGSAWQTITSI